MVQNRNITGFVLLACVGLLVAGAAHAKNFIVDASAPGCISSKEKGDEGALVFCNIQDAIDAAYLDGGGDVVVFPGIYRENLVLREDVKIQGDEPGVIVELPAGPLPEALVIAANHSAIEDITLRLPVGAGAGIPLVLISGVEEVEIENVIIDGGFNRDSIGIRVQNLMLETSRVRGTTLRKLEVGILAEDTLFRITRCLFEDILRDGIHAAPPQSKENEVEFETPDLGDDEDLELSGFNRFRNIGGFTDELDHIINENDSYFLRNTTGGLLSAQLNDWGQYTSPEIATRISDVPPGGKRVQKGDTPTVVFEPYLGKGIFPGSVFVRLRDSLSLASLTNGAPRLQLNFQDTNIDPAFDAVSKLYSFTFINPNTYTVLGAAPNYISASRPATVLPASIVALEIMLTSNGGEGEGEGETPIHSTDVNRDNKINLSEVLRIIQFYNSAFYHCAVGTEDGFAPADGLRDCTPHASDYAPQDWHISLGEILRVIQFYNSEGYYVCQGTEDGYCPGVALVKSNIS